MKAEGGKRKAEGGKRKARDHAEIYLLLARKSELEMGIASLDKRIAFEAARVFPVSAFRSPVAEALTGGDGYARRENTFDAS
jgi:hypothetical protein